MGKSQLAREPVYIRQDLSTMQAWPLERKIQMTQAKIIKWYRHYNGNLKRSEESSEKRGWRTLRIWTN